MSAADYAYLFTDSRTGKVLAQLPMVNVSYETKLNASGTFTANLPLFDPKVQAIDWQDATIPARCSAYIIRNDVAVWGGIIWTRDYDSQKQQLDISCGTFENYYQHLPCTTPLSWTNIEQFAIVRQLLATVNVAGVTIPIPVSTNNSGVLQTFQVLGYDYKWVSDILSSLQQLPNGFDFAVDVYYSPAVGPYKQLNLAYPRRGFTASQTPYVFEYPGNIMYYKWPEDGSVFATNVVETGAGSGPTMPVGQSDDAPLIYAGWPLMYGIVSRKDITSVDALNAYAAGDADLYSSPGLAAELHVRADLDPVLGTYLTGDDIRVRIVDPRFPNGIDTFLRIQDIKVTVSDDGAEDVTITAIGTLT